MDTSEKQPHIDNVGQEILAEKQSEKEGIVDYLRAKKEEQINEIESLDFKDIGYTEEEVLQNVHFRNEFNRYIEESDDDPENFIDLLSQRGIHIVRNSRFLKSQQSQQQFLKTISGEGSTGVNAIFVTREMMQTYLGDDIPKNIRREIEEAVKSSGAMFLAKKPNPKSIFHEGAHAIQYLSRMNMDATDEKTKLKREIEVNTALIHLKNTEKLSKVSRGEYRTGKGPFGETASLLPNDIYQEVDYFMKNKEKLSELTLEEEKLRDEQTSTEEIKKAKEELEELF